MVNKRRIVFFCGAAFLIFAVVAGVAFLFLSQGQEPPRKLTTFSSPTVSEVGAPEQVLSSPKQKVSLREKYCENPHGATCSSRWPSVDPTGRVLPDVTGEVLALRQLRRIIRSHPDWSTTQVDEDLAKKLYTPERIEVLEKVFESVLKEIFTFLQDLPPSVLSFQEKEALIEQVKRIRLETPPPAKVYFDAPDLFTKNTVYYERTSRGELRLRIGGAYLLSASSLYNLMFTLAHEVAHSIDPCEASYAKISPKIYQPLMGCFVRMGWVKREDVHCRKGEQVSEVFADWLATEITVRVLEKRALNYTSTQKVKSVINFSRDLCEQSSSPDRLHIYSHRAPQVRIGSIIGQSPFVRKVVGCDRVVVRNYCQLSEGLLK